MFNILIYLKWSQINNLSCINRHKLNTTFYKNIFIFLQTTKIIIVVIRAIEIIMIKWKRMFFSHLHLKWQKIVWITINYKILNCVMTIIWSFIFILEYMKHASCMKMMLTEDNHCGRHYKLLVNQVSGEAAQSSVCWWV